MASARQAQLAEQRRASKSLQFGDARRVLSPSSNSIASISRKTTTAELEAMISKYNDGLISNEEMRSFLQKSVNAPGLTPSDKTDLDQQIRDFDSRVQKDQLEAQYKGAQDNSIAKVQAASALAAFYQTRAASMVPGTPAHSQAIENQGVWQNSAVELQQKAATLQRRNMRYGEEQKINQLPNNSAERSYAKSQMYKKLYDQALADGDNEDANKYASYYQQELTNAEEKATNEYVTGEKTEIKNIMGQLVDSYHDGRINEAEYLQVLSEIAPRIEETGDYGLINALNRTTDTVYKNQQKGGMNRGTTSDGLPVVLGKSKGGTGSGTNVDSDSQFTEIKRSAEQDFREGRISAVHYAGVLADAAKERVVDLQETVNALSQMNPDSYTKYNGRKTKVSDALDKYEKELGEQSNLVNQVRQGDAAVVFNEKTKKYDIVRPSQTKDFDKLYVTDSQGIAYKAQEELTPASEEDEMNPDLELVTKEGKKYLKGQIVNMYDPNGNLVQYRKQGDRYLPIINENANPTIKRDLDNLTKYINQKADEAVKAGKTFNSNDYLFNSEGLQSLVESGEMKKVAQTVENKKKSADQLAVEQARGFVSPIPQDQMIKEKPTVRATKILQAVNNPIGAVIDAGIEKAADVVKPIAPVVKQAVTNFGKTPTATPINPNQASFNSIGTKAPEPVIKVPQQAKSNPVVKQELNKALPAAKQMNFNPQPQNLLQKAGSFVSNAAQSVKNAYSEAMKKLPFKFGW